MENELPAPTGSAVGLGSFVVRTHLLLYSSCFARSLYPPSTFPSLFCTNLAFLFSVIRMFRHLGTCILHRDCLSEGWLILRGSEQLTQQHAFHVQTNPEPTGSPSGPLFPSHPLAGYQMTRDSLYTLEPVEIIQTSQC